MKVVVFVGPSLSRSAAREILAAELRPPAALGDVYRAARDRPDVIILIDGYFDTVPSVWHKELLFAMAQGIAVVGCASMGAIRAAELHEHGMIGVGRVFESFRSGHCADDDEVAVAHADAEHDFRCLSDAMVNLRHWLATALARGAFPTEVHDDLARHAKRLYFPERHRSSTVERAARHRVDRAGVDLLMEVGNDPGNDVKRCDALLALQLAAAGRFRPGPPRPFEPTNAWTWFERTQDR